LKAGCPFVEYTSITEAHELGKAVEAQWAIYRTTSAPHVDHDLIKAAYVQPRLRVLFPSHSHRTLNFSRGTRSPYTRDVPSIKPRPDGTYSVTWRHERSRGGPAVEEADNPHDAVARSSPIPRTTADRQSQAPPTTLTALSQIPHRA
jgi:hypothetical protein